MKPLSIESTRRNKAEGRPNHYFAEILPDVKRRRRYKILVCISLAILSLLLSGSTLAKTPKSSAGNVKVYRFDNLDVEGKVKAPQLMYFLKRIRSKFRSFRLPRQNFTRKTLELKDSNLL